MEVEDPRRLERLIVGAAAAAAAQQSWAAASVSSRSCGEEALMVPVFDAPIRRHSSS